MDTWTDTMTTRERVRAVAETITEPRSVNWIREQAAVSSWDTTKDELELLVEQGSLRRVTLDNDIHYVPDFTRKFLNRIKELAENHSKSELREEIVDITEEIEEWKETYDVESREELEASLTEAEDLSSDEIRERTRVLEYWEENLYYKRLVGHALHLYDDIEDTMRLSDPEASTSSPPADS